MLSLFTSLLRRTAIAAAILALAGCQKSVTPPVDTLVLGAAGSEKAHALAADHSETLTGGMGETARRILPLAQGQWEGGKLSFKMRVDPARQNYLTAKFWGGEGNVNRLILFCEGRQVGYRHLGDIDLLDFGSDRTDELPCNGRFYYWTTPLPEAMTRGKTELNLEVRATGRIWGYGDTFERYQKPMEGATRGIYRIYTHTDGFFAPPADEKQGAAPVNPPVVKAPGDEILNKVKDRVNREVTARLNDTRPMSQVQMQLVAKAYYVKWTPAFQNPKAVERILASLDEMFRAYRKNPRLAEADPATPNADWFGVGICGEVLSLLKEQLSPALDAEIDDGTGAKVTRRAAFSEMLVICRDWHTRHRRLYTNQSMINDLYGIYLANRGVQVADPEKAWPEEKVRRYLYESVGLQPWLGSDPDPANPAAGRNWGIAPDYMQLTGKGLTKELGFVGYYGEVLDWMTSIYHSTRPAPGQPGDEKIRAQLVKAEHARGVFRYPALDGEGNRAMRAETIIGWRDAHWPGQVTYGERVSWDGSAIYSAAATLDPHSVGYAQQMFEDNQFFKTLDQQMKEQRGFRVTAGLLPVPDDYEALKARPPVPHRLPMAPGQPDFVFTDEEDGVVALKNGDEILYVSLYWRARHGINFLSRVHHITPRMDRVAVVRNETQFEDSGMKHKRRDHIDFGFANGGHKYPGDLRSAHAGEELPIAKIPGGVTFKPGDESVYAGKGSFYTLRYGPYLIGMNMTMDKTFDLAIPADAKPLKDLVSGRADIRAGTAEKIAPRSTMVLLLGN
jgi:hypothetical protein